MRMKYDCFKIIIGTRHAVVHSLMVGEEKKYRMCWLECRKHDGAPTR